MHPPRLSHALRAALLAATLSVVGCSAPKPLTCSAGQDAMTSELLYFGTTKKDGSPASEAEWQAFLREVVTPRFPDGLTVFRATGQWKTKTEILSEATYVLNVVHQGAAKNGQALVEIVAEYKKRFAQESVLRVSSPACAAF